MAKSATIRARMDPQLKEAAEDILHELGLSTTQALTLFYQQICLTKGLPFAVQLPDESPGAPPRPAAEEASAFPANPKRAIMKRNAKAYRAMHSELVKHYLGQFVAICNAQLVDHDADPVALLQRVRTKYPDQVILRRKVERVPDRDLRLRHPRFESR